MLTHFPLSSTSSSWSVSPGLKMLTPFPVGISFSSDFWKESNLPSSLSQQVLYTQQFQPGRKCFSFSPFRKSSSAGLIIRALLFFFCHIHGIWKFQAKGRIRAAAASLHHSHSNAGSLTHWVKPWIEPMSPWLLVRFITAEPQRELHKSLAFEAPLRINTHFW